MTVMTWEEKERVQAGWREFLGRYSWDCFFTMTYRDPARSDMNATGRAERLLTKEFGNLGKNLRAFIVAEAHRSGMYHAHGLLILGLEGDWARMMRSELWHAAKAKYGLCRFDMVRDPDAVNTYLTKYMTKAPSDWRLIGLERQMQLGASS